MRLFFYPMSNLPILEIRPGNKHWPEILSQIPDPPKQLYCRGNLGLLNSMCFAVVGTRKSTPYGKDAAQSMTKELVNRGFTVVSGLALGIDGVVHKSAIDNKGKTIAVLGSGVDDNTLYPKNHIGLAHDILKKDGLIISEYPAKFKATDWTFPKRNRIISGLSKGVLVVEADRSSGALITAQFALEQNRDVFAIPGSIFSSKSIGPNTLIKSGAKLVASIHDIISEYESNPELFQSLKQTAAAGPVENKILEILDNKDNASADEIVEASGLEVPEAMASLSMLEIMGLIKNLGNGKYRKI